jgi:hypothetical protein
MGNIFDGCGGREPEIKKEEKRNYNNFDNNQIRYHDESDEEYIIENTKTKVHYNNKIKNKTYNF